VTSASINSPAVISWKTCCNLERLVAFCYLGLSVGAVELEGGAGVSMQEQVVVGWFAALGLGRILDGAGRGLPRPQSPPPASEFGATHGHHRVLHPAGLPGLGGSQLS
jgi:hypothetical protein